MKTELFNCASLLSYQTGFSSVLPSVGSLLVPPAQKPLLVYLIWIRNTGLWGSQWPLLRRHLITTRCIALMTTCSRHFFFFFLLYLKGIRLGSVFCCCCWGRGVLHPGGFWGWLFLLKHFPQFSNFRSFSYIMVGIIFRSQSFPYLISCVDLGWMLPL